MSTEKRARNFEAYLHNALSFIVFIFLDFLEAILCLLFKCLDKFFEGKSSPCYCGSKNVSASSDDDEVPSESLYGRRNVFSKIMSFFLRESDDSVKSAVKHRWSDCNCESCLSWIKDGDRLHVVINEPSGEGNSNKTVEDVIFIHGFLSSSSFWKESVFKNISESKKQSYRLFAIDLLGFGRSPKPMDCLYTTQDHLKMIEKSVIDPYELKSFHLVAHSMGCSIAVALAAKYSQFIKSITLVAPPCFPCSKDGTSVEVLKQIAEKKLWPLGAFHRSVMSWYEHLGRCFCFIICRHHTTWERVLKLLTKKRDLSFAVKDMTKHTHHSSWHSMHNVICGAAKSMDGYLEILKNSGVKICIIHGDHDTTVPIDCSYNIKSKIPHAELSIIPNATHSSLILRRKKDFTQNLEHFWASSCLEKS